MLIPLAIFFGFIGFALVTLLIINKIADKYLHGDFIKFTEEDEEDNDGGLNIDVEVKTQDHYAKQRQKEVEAKEKVDSWVAEQPLTASNPVEGVATNVLVTNNNNRIIIHETKHVVGSPPPRPPPPIINVNVNSRSGVTPTHVLSIIEENKTSTLSESTARVKATLEYDESSNLVTGTITSVRGLSSLTLTRGLKLPEEICFHIKITPLTRKYNAKTKWRTYSPDEDLSLNFKLGPLKKTMDLDKSTIYFRLYGKKKTRASSRSHCYGECCIALDEVVSSHSLVQLDQDLLPKNESFGSQYEIHSTTTDSE